MKLTIKNYKEATKDIDFSKLPEAAREAHKEFDSFADFYHEDKDIKEMLDNHFKIVEPYLKKQSSKPQKWEIVFTDAGGVINASNKHERENGDYRVVAQVNRHTGKVSWKIPKLKVPDDAMMKIKNYAKGIIQKNERRVPPIEDARKPVIKSALKTKSPAKKTSSKTAKRKPNEVDVMPLEIKIIRRYINMHGQKVSERQVSLLYKVIQKAATEKTIRKSSKYADEIKKIGNDLITTYKEMDGTCTFDVPQALYNKLKGIVDGYGVTPAIALIKRFINLYGNITKTKAQRLLTSVTNSLKNGKVSKADKEYEQIKSVEKHLNDYLESDKLLVTNIQLNGLKGLAGLGK